MSDTATPTRCLVRPGPKPSAAEPNKIARSQKEIVYFMRRGYRVFHGLTKHTYTAGGTQDFGWGDMLCLPDKTSGRVIRDTTLRSLVEKGFLEKVPYELDMSSLDALTTSKSTPHESYRLTALGLDADLRGA